MLLIFVLRLVVAMLVLRAIWRMLSGVIDGVSRPTTRRSGSPDRGVQMVRDPVCGTFLPPEHALTLAERGSVRYFCSEKCRDTVQSPIVKPAVLLTRRIPASVLARLEAVCSVDLYRGEEAIPRAEMLARIGGKQALLCLLTDRVDREVLEAGADLRIVANIAVGYDNIDLAAARARAIPVTNTPDVLTEATAELTWALILTAARRVAEGERLLRGGTWKGWALDFMLGMELRGKQLGIVGLGRIGSAVAARAPAFGMTVAACTLEPPSPFRLRREAATADEPGAGGRAASREPDIETMTLDRLLATSDVVTLHVPLTPATRHLIDRAALSRMKRSAYLVNTSRGPVVDEGALAWALGERLIAGAALDVYEQEPRVHPGLLELPNVVLAPHLGSATTETRTAMASLAVDNVLAVLDGRPPLTPVTDLTR